MTDDSRSGQFWRILPFLAPLVYAAALLFSLSNEWFPCDDLVELGFVRNADSFLSLWGTDIFGYFRPIKNALFFGFSRMEPLVGAGGCRMAAIAIGILSFFAVLALCRRVFGNERKALLAASVWLLSPTLVSSAAWLSCLNIQIMALCTASTIALHDSAWDGGTFRVGRIAIAAVLLFLALVSYECAVAAAPILLTFDWILRPGRLRTREARWAHAAYWAVVVLYLAIRAGSTAKFVATGSWVEAERWQISLSSPWFATQHFTTWFWPFGRFTVLGSYRWGDVSMWTLAACAVLGCCVLLFAILSRKRWPVLSFCILFALFGFAPVSNVLGSGNGPYGDYYLTLSSIGLAAGCVELAFRSAETKGFLRWPAVAIVIVFGMSRIAAIAESARWARFWNGGMEAYEESCRNFPSFLSNRMAILEKASNDGRYEEALALAREFEKDVPPVSRNMQIVHVVRALHALNVEKDADKALEQLERFGRLATDTSRPKFSVRFYHYYRGCVFEDLQDDETAARAEYETALQGNWGVDLVPCADRLARLKAIHGERGEAISLWEKAARLDPENVAVLWNLATAWRQSGDKAKSDALKRRLAKLTGK